VPYRRERIVVARHGGLGDVLMCTPGLRELKLVNPGCHVTFHSPYGVLLRGLPYIDEIREYDEKNLPPGTIRFWVEDSLPPWRHLSEMMADHLALRIRDTRPDCIVDPQITDRFRTTWTSRPRPWVLVNRYSSGYTPNKDWFEDRWDELIERLVRRVTVIEIGNRSGSSCFQPLGNYVDLRCRTSLEELAAAIAASDLFISPVSGPVHIAAAVGTPGVVIYGGYEKPVCSRYEGNINLTTEIACSPCFMNDPCPIDKECLKRITPRQVEDAVDRLWRQLGEEGTLHGVRGDVPMGPGRPIPAAVSSQFRKSS
jgi:ADP-heptose:LPS heptosyltransferase